MLSCFYANTLYDIIMVPIGNASYVKLAHCWGNRDPLFNTNFLVVLDSNGRHACIVRAHVSALHLAARDNV